MPRSFRARSAIVYWIVAIAIAGWLSYTEQKAVIEHCTITEGVVVDEVYVRKGRRDVLCPQVSYLVGWEELFFVDKTANSLSIGDKVKVAYQTNYPSNAFVYDFGFWINYWAIILTWLIAFVGFGLIWGLTKKFSKGTEVLPSNSPV